MNSEPNSVYSVLFIMFILTVSEAPSMKPCRPMDATESCTIEYDRMLEIYAARFTIGSSLLKSSP